MFQRSTASFTAAALFTLGGAALAPSVARADLQLTAPPIVFGTNTFGLNFFPGTNSQVSAGTAVNYVSSTFTGDITTSLQGSSSSGTYLGATTQGAIVPFSVSTLPVRIGDAALSANFKVVASGGNGVTGGNDPVVTVTIHTRICQVTSNVYQPASDPFVPSSEFIQTYIQNGNGLQIVDSTSGPVNVNYVLTPGNYYMYQELTITTSYTSTGAPQLTPGMTVEFGGTLTHGTYSGLTYAFAWQTVPAPSAVAALSLGALTATRRRRR
jgi:hypothetical protein